MLPGDEVGEGLPAAAPGASGRVPVLRFMGIVKRRAAGNDRVATLKYDPSGGLLACQGAGKNVEVFRCGWSFVAALLFAFIKLPCRWQSSAEKALLVGSPACGEQWCLYTAVCGKGE